MHQDVFGTSDPGSPIVVIGWRGRARCRYREAGTGTSRGSGRTGHGSNGSRQAYFAGSGLVDAVVRNIDDLAPGERVAGPAIMESAVTTVVVDPGALVERSRAAASIIRPWGDMGQRSATHPRSQHRVGGPDRPVNGIVRNVANTNPHRPVGDRSRPPTTSPAASPLATLSSWMMVDSLPTTSTCAGWNIMARADEGGPCAPASGPRLPPRLAEPRSDGTRPSSARSVPIVDQNGEDHFIRLHEAHLAEHRQTPPRRTWRGCVRRAPGRGAHLPVVQIERDYWHVER